MDKPVNRLVSLPILLVCLPPPVGDHAHTGEWCEDQVDDALVDAQRGFFTQLLCCFCTNGALGDGLTGNQHLYEKKENDVKQVLHEQAKLLDCPDINLPYPE